VLLRLDESSYSGGTHGEDHPIAWTHSLGKGRAFYTGLGHTVESWQEPLLLQHVEQGLLWAAN
jgi:type 1 glutamine amidotransferase